MTNQFESVMLGGLQVQDHFNESRTGSSGNNLPNQLSLAMRFGWKKLIYFE